MHIPNILTLVQHIGTHSPILDTSFTFPTIERPQQLRLNTTEGLQYWRTVTKDATNYGYISPRQLIYFVKPRISIPSSADSSTALVMDLPPLVAECEEARVLLLTLLRVEVLVVLQHRFSFFPTGEGFLPRLRDPTFQQPTSSAWL